MSGRTRAHAREQVCFFCDETYNTNKYFGDYGFSVPTCQKCLKEPLKNLELANLHLKYTWFEMQFKFHKDGKDFGLL